MLAIVAAVLLAAASQHDTVFTSDGGRLVGTVVEEGPRGVAIQLADGTFRRFGRREVVRIEYADGSVSKPAEAQAPSQSAPQPPPAYTPAPPPGYAPPPPPQAYPPPPPRYAPPPPAYRPPAHPGYGPPPSELRGGGPLSPMYLSFGLGGAFLSGEVEQDVRVSRVFSSQLNLAFEGGVRLTPHLALGLYADLGFGDPGREIRDACSASGIDCDATTGRFGVLLRHTFQPAARTTPWVAAGTGFEFGSISTDDFGGSRDVLSYRGWEVLRLMGGVDFRSNRVVGVGLYAGVAFGRYGHVEDDFESVSIDNRAFHTTVEGGVRFTLFP
jgi:hypothetical protein